MISQRLFPLGRARLPRPRLEGYSGGFAGNKACCAEQANPNERPGTGGRKTNGKENVFRVKEQRNQSLLALSRLAGSPPAASQGCVSGALAPGSLGRQRDSVIL